MEVAMIARTLPILTLLALAACSGKKTPITASPEAMKLRKDAFTGALSKQLEILKFQNEISYDGPRVTIRLRQARAGTVRQAICEQGGGTLENGRKARLDQTL